MTRQSSAVGATAGLGSWRQFGPVELTPILQAALEAFQADGFHGATVRDIARRVGQTVPSLYYHHASKEGAFVALLDLGTSEVAWRVRAAADEADGRPELQFVNVIEAIMLHMAHRRQLASLDNEVRHLSGRNRSRYASRRKVVENVLRGIVEAGTEQGVFSPADPVETARALLGMCQSVARWYHPGGPLDAEQLAERYVDIALRTVGLDERPGTCARGRGRT